MLLALLVLIPPAAYFLSWNRVSRAAADYTGHWQIRMVLDTPVRDGVQPQPRKTTTVGSLRLWADTPVVASFHYSGVTTVTYSYRSMVVHEVFGPELDTLPGLADYLHQVRGRMLENDSILLVINPHVDDAGFRLHGVLSGDTIEGRWVEYSEGLAASGRFVMARPK